MQFIYNKNKRFGNKMSLMIGLLEKEGFILDSEQESILLDKLLMDSLPDKFYTDGLLNFDEVLKDMESVIDCLNYY